MNLKIKAYIAIWLMSLTFYLSVDTKYVMALGDYVFEFLGYKAWSGNQEGTHYAAIFFLMMFFIALLFVGFYAVERLGMKKMKVFIVFVLLVTSYTVTTGFFAQEIKKNSDGLLSIAYDSKDNHLDYKYKEDGDFELNLVLNLKNYGDESKEFFMSFDSRWSRADGLEPLEVLNKDGSKASFILHAGEEKTFELRDDLYKLSRGESIFISSSRGGIDEVILSNKEEVVQLTQKNFFGIHLKK